MNTNEFDVIIKKYIPNERMLKKIIRNCKNIIKAILNKINNLKKKIQI